MFRILFFITVFVTLAVNIILLFATKDKPPDPTSSTTTLVSVITSANITQADASPFARFPSEPPERPSRERGPSVFAARRLFLRSNDFYDYSPAVGDAYLPEVAVADNDNKPSASSSQPTEDASRAADGRQTEHGSKSAPVPEGQVGRPRLSGANRRSMRETQSDPTVRVKQRHESGAVRDKNRRAGDPARYGNGRNGEPATMGESASDSGARRPSSATGTNGEGANEITRTASGRQTPVAKPAANTLLVRVKSSKNHVLIKVDNLIIYESGSADSQRQQQQQQQASSWRAGRVRRNHRRHRQAEGENANLHERPAEVGDKDTADEPVAGRGIHVVVLNQFDGFVMSSRLFDTYSPQQDDELAFFLGQIRDGRLVVLAVQDEASFKMARQSAARKLIQRTLGSRRIMDLAWRDMWALVAQKRHGERLETNTTIGERQSASDRPDSVPVLAEGLSKSASFTDWASPVELSAEVQLEARSAASADQCAWSQDGPEVRVRRRLFCNRIEGYGRVCDCRHPSRLEFQPGTIKHSQINQVPIVVVASNRPFYLYRMLRSLLQAEGVRASMVTVFIDGFYDEPREICKLLNLRYVQNKPQGSRSARISHHYKTSLTQTFERLFPDAQFAIIFEEDLDVARDALVYFNQTLQLLSADPSLYCVSAWNDQGYEHSVGDLKQLKRVETMPGLGWMLTRGLFVDQLKGGWPSASQPHDWDMWIRTPQVRRGRECVIPDVSRTFHFGSTGTNINSYFQRQYFSEHAFSDNLLPSGLAASLEFDNLDSLDETGYEGQIERLLRDGRQSGQSLLRQWFTPERLQTDNQRDTGSGGATERLASISSEALCAYANTTFRVAADAHQGRSVLRVGGEKAEQQTNILNVIFIKMIDSEDYKNWLRLAKCWRIWDLDARGQHKSMWRLYVNGQQTLVVGYPASTYSKLKPPGVAPYDFHIQSAAR